MVRILLASALILALTSVAEALYLPAQPVAISNRGCILDVTSADGDSNLALWISPIDVAAPIVKLDVGNRRSVNVCGYAMMRAGTYGITAVLGTTTDVDYHSDQALRGTAVITIPEGKFTIPELTLTEPEPRPQPRPGCVVPEAEPEPSTDPRAWLLGGSGGLLALLALFARRREADTHIV